MTQVYESRVLFGQNLAKDKVIDLLKSLSRNYLITLGINNYEFFEISKEKIRSGTSINLSAKLKILNENGIPDEKKAIDVKGFRTNKQVHPNFSGLEMRTESVPEYFNKIKNEIYLYFH